MCDGGQLRGMGMGRCVEVKSPTDVGGTRTRWATGSANAPPAQSDGLLYGRSQIMKGKRRQRRRDRVCARVCDEGERVCLHHQGCLSREINAYLRADLPARMGTLRQVHLTTARPPRQAIIMIIKGTSPNVLQLEAAPHGSRRLVNSWSNHQLDHSFAVMACSCLHMPASLIKLMASPLLMSTSNTVFVRDGDDWLQAETST
jgi:hypothetical protein